MSFEKVVAPGSPQWFAETVLDPGLVWVAAHGGPPVSVSARRILFAIAVQESGLKHRKQVGGPARGFWQFEKMGGVAGVLQHEASAESARRLCESMLVHADVATAYEAIAFNDPLAVAFARLLLWTDPKPLPTTRKAGWDYYLRNWRPGRPHPEAWPIAWRIATNSQP